MIMLTFHSRDPRDPAVLPQPPEPGTEYLRFQRDLAATEQIRTLAHLLANVHWLYEGWFKFNDPLQGELARIYTQAACLAVRECSEPERNVADDRAEMYGLQAFPELERQLASCDTTPEIRRGLIYTFVRQCLSVRRFALMHGTAVRSDLEQGEIQRSLDEEPSEQQLTLYQRSQSTGE
jgi:hypothetical protein